MSPNELKTMLARRPFVPIRIHVAEITHYDVYNPEMAVVGQTVLFIGLTRNVANEYFDEPVIVALRHITRVEPLIEAMAVPGAENAKPAA
jgi:hypothetical protein